MVVGRCSPDDGAPPLYPWASVLGALGHDPGHTDWVRRHLGARCRFKITPVLDPLDQTPVDAYEIPQRHRQAVHLLTPADTFPYAPTPPGRCRSTTPSPGPHNDQPPASDSPASGTTDP